MIMAAVCVKAQVNPQVYYTFDLANPLSPQIGSTAITPTGAYTINTGGQVGKYVSVNRVVNQELRGQSVPTATGFTVELLWKAEYGWDQNRDPYMWFFGNAFVKFQYPQIWFYTVSAAGADNFQITLQGLGPQSWSYYKKGWHHLVFTYNATSGQKVIYVDGTSPSGFSKNIAGSTLSNGSGGFQLGLNSSFQNGTMSFDEVAVYNQAISAGQVQSNYRNALAGSHYQFQTTAVPSPPAVTGPADSLEYPRGYVVGTNNSRTITQSQLQQLKEFPRPRFRIGTDAPKNFNWMQLDYISDYKQPGVTDEMAVDTSMWMNLELAQNWNYMVMVNPNIQSMRNYNDTNRFEGRGVAFANRNPQFKTSVISFWKGLQPNRFGMAADQNYFNFQSCPDNNYIRNASSQFIGPSGTVSGTKYRSPASPNDSLKNDARAFKATLKLLTDVLTDTLDYLNENNEIMTLWDTTAMRLDPVLVAGRNAAGFGDTREYLAYGYRRFWTLCIDSMRTLPRAGSTSYTMYQVEGADGSLPRVPYVRFNFRQFRQSNQDALFGNTSTFDFYPRFVNNWRFNAGPWRGIQPIVEARAVETPQGAKYFTPFIGAGWSPEEEKNLRHAQWLGLLKVVGMLGARFYYTGYFNEAASYNPPNPPPYPPRGYIYQAAAPVYAQAACDWVMDNGNADTLLSGDVPNNYQFNNFLAYRYYSGCEEVQTVVRKLKANNQYHVATCYPNSSNAKGSTPIVDTAVFSLAGKTISVETRRQGSVYAINLDRDTAVIIQYDDWHEYPHPQRWSKDFWIQAEHYGKYVRGQKDVRTIPYQSSSATALNFVGDTTFITWRDSAAYTRDTLTYQINSPYDTTLYLWVLCRSLNGTNSGFAARMDNGTAYTQDHVLDQQFLYYRTANTGDTIKWTITKGLHTFKLFPTSARTEIDKFLLGMDKNTALPLGTPGSATPCGVAFTPVISPSGPVTQCGGSVVLTSTAGASYAWSNGQTTQSITVSTTGNYSVVVTDGAGCTGTSAAVSVTINTPITVSISPATATSCGSNVSLSATAAPAYLWSTGATTQTISVGAGTYTVTVTAVSGCTAVATRIVSAGVVPTATITPSGSVSQCGGSLTLSASGGASYLWSTGATTSTITVGSGSYTVTATSASGCTTASAATTVTINPAVTASVSPATATTCGGNVTLTASGGSTYLWSSGQITSTVSVPAGVYTVTATGTGGCTGQATATVSNASAATAAITPSGTVSQCGGSVLLTASAGSSYLWSTGETTQSITASSSGSYRVTVTAGSGCTATSAPTTVTISAVPSAFISPSQSIIQPCQGSTQTLTSSTAASYLWSTGATTQAVNITQSGTYRVTVTATNGCTAISPATTLNFVSCACTAPQNTVMAQIWRYAAVVGWQDVPAATKYMVTITQDSDTTRTQTKIWNSGTTGVYFNRLRPGTKYRVDVKSLCGTDQSSTATIYFTTRQ